MKQWDDKDLDQFLDQVLSEYSQEAPRAGLEHRILANLAAEPARPRRWWIWAAVPACAAILITALLLVTALRNPVQPPAIAETPTAPVVTKVVTNQQQPVRNVVAHVHTPALKHRDETSTVAVTPKLQTFPSQSDETQVRLALQFVQNNPALAQQVVKEEEQFQEAVARNLALQDLQNRSETQ